MIQVLRTGSTGWWYARHMVTNQEGWVPSTFLQPALKAHSHLSVSSGGMYILLYYHPAFKERGMY